MSRLDAEFERHNTNLTTLAAADGFLASGDMHGTVRVWDAATGEEVLQPMKDQIFRIWDVAFGPNGTLVTASQDATIVEWATATGSRIGTPITGSEGWFEAVAYGPADTILSGDSRGKLRIWDATTHEQIGHPIFANGGSITEFALDGNTLLVAGWDGSARLFDLGFLTEDPLTVACEQLGRALTDEERSTYLPGRENLSLCE